MTDCLIIGYNDLPFGDYVEMARSMGEDSGAFRDLNLAFLTHDGVPRRALDILSDFAADPSRSYYNTGVPER